MSQSTVLITGGSGQTGAAIFRELQGRGIHAVTVSRSIPEEIGGEAPASVQDQAHKAQHFTTDLTDEADIMRLKEDLAEQLLQPVGIIHLVGGWSGGKGVTGQTDLKYRSLAVSFDTLRLVSGAFHDVMVSAGVPRVITVSTPLAHQPTPNSGNYSAVKAATEAWTLSLNASFQRDTQEGCASILVTDSLAGREESFAKLVADTYEAPASRVAGKRILHV